MTSTKDWVKGYGRAAAGYRITKNKYSEDSTADLGVIPTQRQKKTIPEIQNTGTKILNTAPRNCFKDKEHKHKRRLRRDKTPFNFCKRNRPRARSMMVLMKDDTKSKEENHIIHMNVLYSSSQALS